jgi:hypothetical protein
VTGGAASAVRMRKLEALSCDGGRVLPVVAEAPPGRRQERELTSPSGDASHEGPVRACPVLLANATVKFTHVESKGAGE